jgi:DNA invertase Pin-like site-specific DNA recombinase
MTAHKAVSYLRVSGKGQVQGDGFQRQRDAVARFARQRKFDLVEEFRDEGISGTKDLSNRPGLGALLDRIESNGVKVVIVERADRLARDLMVSEVILDQLTRAGAQVLTSEGADLTATDDDPTRTLIRQVLAAVAQFDKGVTVLKLRASRDRIRRHTGRCEGRKPYGFRQDERQLVERIYQLRRKRVGAKRLSCADIADRLNSEGHVTRYGRSWSRAAIHRILTRRDANSSTSARKLLNVSRN